MGEVHYLFPADTRDRASACISGQDGDAEKRAFGNRMASLLDPTDRSLVSATTLSSPLLVATLLRCDSGVSRFSSPMPVDEAFIVSVQLRDLPFHELTLRDTSVYSGPYPMGGVCALDLEDDPRFFFPSPFLCMQFYVRRASLDALADEYGVKRIQTLSWPHGAVDETVSQLALALLTALQNSSGAGRLFTDHVALALNTHLAYAYGGMRAATPPAHERLAPWQLRRCEQIMTEGLAEINTVDQLAKACGLPASRFLAAFKRTTGESTFSRLAKRSDEDAKTRLGRSDRVDVLTPGRSQ
jgi:AraC family transcriptional regulator